MDLSNVPRLLKARFASVRQDLDEILSRFTDADLNWGSWRGVKTVADEILEIADKDREAVIWLKMIVWPDDKPPAFDAETTNLAGARAALALIRQTTCFYRLDDGGRARNTGPLSRRMLGNSATDRVPKKRSSKKYCFP